MNVESSGTASESPVPAGWYPHPRDPQKFMYWNGSDWELTHTAPRYTEVPTPLPETAKPSDPEQEARTQAFEFALMSSIDAQERALVNKLRRSGPTWVLLGFGFAIVASIIGMNSAGDGNGVIWTGGYVVAAFLIFKGWQRYRATRSVGVPNPEGWMLALIGVAATVAVYAGFQYWSVYSNGGFREGSCVTEGGELVPCGSSSAEYVVTELTDSRAKCPDWSGVIDNGSVICFESK